MTRENIQTAVQADHEILAFGIAQFKASSGGQHPLNSPHHFANTLPVLTEKIVAHFQYEDTRLFPLLLAENPPTETTQLIAELRHEHVQLQERLRQLNAHVQFDPKGMGQSWEKAIMDFFTDLESHADKEHGLLDLFV